MSGVMRGSTAMLAAILGVGSVACRDTGAREARAAAPGVSATAATSTDTLATTAIIRTAVGLFKPLPDRMTTPANPMTPAKVALGRLLFHEPVLSNGHDVSCNTCHALNGYGADGRRVSFGDLGHAGGRNSPTVYNAAGQVAQFWDGRAATVEEQAKGPVLNPKEMAMPDSAAVLAHMRESAQYRAAFRAAFPGQPNPINYDNVGRAIGAFERGLVTPARWDRFLRGDARALTDDEKRGLATFVTSGCASCHNGTYVGGNAFQKAGLAKPWPSQADSGRYLITHRPSDLFVFKVPSLRNVEKTGPYFHDGSVASLGDAVRMMGRYQLGKELDSTQVRLIVAWLGSLTGDLPASYIALPPLPAAPKR